MEDPLSDALPRVFDRGAEMGSYAGFWLRLAAYCIDLAILEVAGTMLAMVCVFFHSLLLNSPVASDVPGTLGEAALFLCACTLGGLIYFTLTTCRTGQTLGKALVGIRVETLDGGLPPSGIALWRTVMLFGFPTLWGFLLLGVADPLFLALRRDKRSLHDLIAGTVVRRVRWRDPMTVFAAAVVSLVVVHLPWRFVVQPYFCQTWHVTQGPPEAQTMKPTVQPEDWLLINKLVYHLREPRFGEIVVRLRHGPALGGSDDIYRVVGVPGDQVCVHVGRLWRNHIEVQEPYVTERMKYAWPDEINQVTVPPGSFVLLGDNRNHSQDCHSWQDEGEPLNYVPKDQIKGLVVAIWWPVARMQNLDARPWPPLPGWDPPKKQKD